MKNKRITRAASVAMLLALLVSMLPLAGMVGAVSAETAAATEAAAPEQETVEVTETSETEPAAESATEPQAEPPDETPSEASSEPETEPEPEVPQETAAETETNPEPAAETRENETTEPVRPGIEKEDLAAAQSGLVELVDGEYVPYYPSSYDPDDLGAGTMAVPSTSIVYRDIFSAHSSDMNGNYVKAGGAYTATNYGAGDTAWFPAASYSGSKELSYDGVHYVCPGAMFSNQGPFRYRTDSVAGAWTYLGLPIRPSQEDGYDYDANAWTNYTASTGVPTYKRENLKSKQIPAYTQAEFTVINLIYAVGNGMGGMKYSSSDANIAAAAYTLIMNTVFGYIGLGSDGLFHGLPIATSNADVNQKMVEILVRCEVYTQEKGLTGSMTGDNTVNRLKSKLGYTPTNMSGYCVGSGIASYVSMSYLQVNQSKSSGNQIYVWASNAITFDQSKTVSLKKTAQGSASVLAAIQDNPLYTLQGAVYEIRQGSATGTVIETLTTNANGEATGTHKYAIGTKLYAVEKTAPDGYLLNTTTVELTVSAGNNVFNVSDTPTFDPNRVVLNKTGTDTTRIKGAVFKFEFYASTWANPDRLLRTWYLQSDDTGLVKYDDAHLATGYNSDPIYKPNGTNPQFPLGCVVVKEVKTADGYVLPNDNDGKVFLFIKQREEDRSAYSFWGNGSGAPLTEQNPRGIYRIENDADKSKLTAVNGEAYGTPFSLQKRDLAGAPLEGAIFQVDYFDATWFDSTKLERTWYFTTDSNGYFTLASQYMAPGYTSSEMFPSNAIPVGIMRVREIAAPEHYQAASFTGVWRMRQVESGSANVDCFWAASDGITPAPGYGDEASVDATDPSILTVFNQRLPYATMTKLVSEGSPEGFRFRLRNETASKTYYGESDAAGNVFLTDKHYVPQLADGDKIYEFTDLTPGMIRFVEVNKQGYVPAYFKFSLVNPSGEATQLAYFDTAAILAATESYGGSDYYSPTFQIKSLPAGSILRIEINNTLKPGTAQMEKLSDTEDVEGFCFKLYHHKDAQHGSKSWYGISDENGAVYVTDQSLTEHGEQERAYTFDGLYDGRYSFIELLSASGRTDVWPEKIELITSGGTTPACHVVFPDPENGYELVADGGDCRISGCELTGLNGGGTLTVKITNKTETPPEPVYGSLTIVKVDRGTREPLDGAGFRLFDAEGTQIAEEYTDQDGFVEFVGLEIGDYTYQEFEAPEGFALDDTLYPFSVTEDNLDIEIEMENDITEGSIRVRKVNEQGQPMKDVFFLLEYSLDDGESWQPIGYRNYSDPVEVGCSTNDETIDGVAVTGTDGWVEFAGLAVNTQLGSIQYRLTEVKTWDGYELLAEPVFEGCLTAEQTEIELVAVNHPSFEMPMTGSDGFAGAGIGLGLCLLASVLLLLFLPKKREDMNNG